jgi:hypothetical protein
VLGTMSPRVVAHENGEIRTHTRAQPRLVRPDDGRDGKDRDVVDDLRGGAHPLNGGHDFLVADGVGGDHYRHPRFYPADIKLVHLRDHPQAGEIGKRHEDGAGCDNVAGAYLRREDHAGVGRANLRCGEVGRCRLEGQGTLVAANASGRHFELSGGDGLTSGVAFVARDRARGEETFLVGKVALSAAKRQLSSLHLDPCLLEVESRLFEGGAEGSSVKACENISSDDRIADGCRLDDRSGDAASNRELPEGLDHGGTLNGDRDRPGPRLDYGDFVLSESGGSRRGRAGGEALAGRAACSDFRPGGPGKGPPSAQGDGDNRKNDQSDPKGRFSVFMARGLL